MARFRPRRSRGEFNPEPAEAFSQLRILPVADLEPNLQRMMVGRAVAEWWFKMKPYAIAYRELWPSLAITAFLYYKISYGGKKAVKDKSSSQGH